jgi:hypothetical protein
MTQYSTDRSRTASRQVDSAGLLVCTVQGLVYVYFVDCNIAVAGPAGVYSIANAIVVSIVNYTTSCTSLQVDDFSELQSVTDYDGGYNKDHTTVQQVMRQRYCAQLCNIALCTTISFVIGIY